VTRSPREQLLDELARCYMRAALNALLADPEAVNKSAAESGQEQRRREVPKCGKSTALRQASST
jgi:hypothetical protein